MTRDEITAEIHDLASRILAGAPWLIRWRMSRRIRALYVQLDALDAGRAA